MIVLLTLAVLAWTIFILYASKHVFDLLDEAADQLSTFRKDPHEPTD